VRIGLLGVPSNSAGTADGVARAPAVLRAAGLVEALGERAEIRDFGDVSLPGPSRTRDPATHLIDPTGFAALVTAVRDAASSILGQGMFPLVIGGDCPLLLGCLAAATRDARVGLLFVDGHEDAYRPEQSLTGEAADTELAFALGLADASWSSELAPILPLLSTHDVRLLGARDAKSLASEGVASLADRAPVVDDGGVAADPVGSTAAATAGLEDPWWFHLDLDVLSTEALSSVDYPQPGGIGWDDLGRVAATALGAAPAGWNITIYNPDLDPDRTDARRIVAFIASSVAPLGRSGTP
jgi:arginase